MKPRERIPLHDHSGFDAGGLIAARTTVTQVLSSGGSSGSATVPNAAQVSIADSGGLFTATNVEAALAELVSMGGGNFVTRTDGGKEVVNTVADAGATETLDLADGNVHDITLTEDCTLTFAGATAGVACSFSLILRQDGTGGWTTTWPGSVVWSGGSAPTLDETLSTLEVLTFVTVDGGTVWLGFATGGSGGASALDDLTDVNAGAPSDQDVLTWDDGAGEWIAQAAPGGGVATDAIWDAAGDLAVGSGADTAAVLSAGTEDHVLTIVSGVPAWAAAGGVASTTSSINFVIDGGGSAITTGIKGDVLVPFACTVDAWTLLADQSGDIVVDVWKDAYASFPPTDADAMPGAGKEPTIAASGDKAQDLTITDWTSDDIAAGDVLRFSVDSCTTITRATLALTVTRV